MLPPLPDLLAAGGIDVESLRFLRRDEGEYAANWKICCENYLECYHCQVAHPGFSRVVDVSPDAYRLEEALVLQPVRPGPRAAGGRVRPVRRRRARPVPLPLPEHDDQRHAGSPEPLDRACRPSVTRANAPLPRLLRSLDVDEEWIADLLAFDHQVGAEDRVLVERVQRGVRSGLLAGGRLLPESERLVAHFQRLLVDALASTAALEPGSARWLEAARRARLLSWLSLVWMGIEGIVGVASGIAAGSIALVAFGLDSFVEGFASLVVVWRFTGARLHSEAAERRAQRLVALQFFLRAARLGRSSTRSRHRCGS